MVGIDWEAIDRMASSLKRVKLGIRVDRFDDERYYPPLNAPRRDVVLYFLVMVAMDHRLSRPGRPYEAVIGGELFHGADLLYYRGAEAYRRDPSFFDPENLARATPRTVVEWLGVEYGGRLVKPPDPDVRAELLRDLGYKLVNYYGGDAYRLVSESKGFLRLGVGEGFIDRLKVFKAYQDPVEKKAFLLAKFLERRGVLEVKDHYNKEVPVDNHLVRIALRTGIISVDQATLEKISLGVDFSEEEDVLIRYTARIAYKEVARRAGIDPFILDDYLWSFGRKCCTPARPTCKATCSRGCAKSLGCISGRCVFQEWCKASSNPLFMVTEHRFFKWWY